MADKREEQLKEITERLEQGVQELFNSEHYTEYLRIMSQFHTYSFNNTLLIAMQKPDATLVAGYQVWRKIFHRQVKRGEKGIQIISPAPIRRKEERDKVDEQTGQVILKPDGEPEKEEVVHVITKFKLATVFDVSQTVGEPLPELGVEELTASVENYDAFMAALMQISPVPIRFDEISGKAKEFYNNDNKEIVIQSGMSESQTLKTAIHEIAHARLHDREMMKEQGIEKDHMTREVEAESVAYTVCQKFGIDTSDYSFAYVASWSSGMKMKELRASMDTIRHTAAEFIDGLTGQIQLQREQQEQYMDVNENRFIDMGYVNEHVVYENADTGLIQEEPESGLVMSEPVSTESAEDYRALEKPVEADYADRISIPAKAVDDILRSGSNRKNGKLRLIYNFMIEQDPEDYTEYVKQEYGTGGKGLVIDGQEYAIWFDEAGMRIAVGHTADNQMMGKAVLSWEDVSGRIRQLLAQGEYASQKDLDAARRNALLEHAQMLAFMKQDMAKGVPEMVFQDVSIFKGPYPVTEEQVAKLLENPDYLVDLNERLSALAAEYEEHPEIMRYKIYNPKRMSAQFHRFAKKAIPYQGKEGFQMAEYGYFITQDEIDAFLARGGCYAGSRISIFAYFSTKHSATEKKTFLKESYGTGGSSHALSGADDSAANYDGKGIKLTRGGYANPYAEVLLPWDKAAKRVDYLIQHRRYLKPEDYAQLEVDQPGTGKTEKEEGTATNNGLWKLTKPDDGLEQVTGYEYSQLSIFDFGCCEDVRYLDEPLMETGLAADIEPESITEPEFKSEIETEPAQEQINYRIKNDSLIRPHRRL